MLVFSSSNSFLIFANLLFVFKVLYSNALIPPPKRSRDHRPMGFINFAKRLDTEFLGSPAKGVHSESLVFPKKMTVFRLPAHIRPRSYALKIVIDNEHSVFFGEVKINVSVAEDSNTVLLHSYRLDIEEVTLYYKNDIISSWFIVDADNQLLRIQTNSTLWRNEVYEIKVKFGSRMNTELVGIYRSAYSIGTKIKFLTLTQFEPRQAFPCFDEPHFRATFDIRVARYQHEIALSNMPLMATSSPDPSIGNRVWNSFYRTPPMPTYLVAFVVAEDFTNISEYSGKYELWAAKNKINEYSYAQSWLARAVKRAEEYTGIEFMLPHLKLVVVNDFYRGAMENWGLMIFKANQVKFEENEDDPRVRHYVQIIVFHETIHQWFGNYVTIKWWDSLWLKEGFATLLPYLIEVSVNPSGNMHDIFIHDIEIKAFENDGTVDRIPMTLPVNTPAEIDRQFNTINYEKAASVLHMLHYIVSPNTFQKALQIYLHTGYTAGGGVTSPDDLWAAFDQQLFLENRSLGNGLTVGQTMKSWTHQVGYPIIIVTRYNKGDRDDIGFKQEPFRSAFAEHSVTKQEWTVPLTCTKGSNPNFNDTLPKLWLLDKEEVILPNEVGTDEWIVCNVRQTGYYRLNYDEESWRLIADVLYSSPEQINRLNRHQIIYDVFTMIKSYRMPYSSVFKIICSLDQENDTLMWRSVTPLADRLLMEFEGTNAYEKLKKFLKKRFNKIYKKVGFYEKSNEARGVRYLRPRLLRAICELDNNDCLSKANAEFNKHNSIDSVPAYSQYAVISAALKINSSSDLTWKKLRYYFTKQTNPLDDEDLMNSFRSLKDESTIKKFLSDLSVGKSDELQKYSLGIVLNHYHGSMAALHFIQEMLPKISEYRAGETIINTILDSISVRSNEQLNMINQILQTIMKLDSKKYENTIRVLSNKKHEAEARVKALDDVSSQILAALDSLAQDSDSDSKISYASQKTSAATSSLSHSIYFSIFTCISRFLLATRTE